MKDKNKKLLVISVVILLVALLMFLIGYTILKGKIDAQYEELKDLKKDISKEIVKKENDLIENDLNTPNYIGIDGFFVGAIEGYTKFYTANEPYESHFTIDADNKLEYKKYSASDIVGKHNYVYKNNIIVKGTDRIFYDKDINPQYYLDGDINFFRYNYVNEFDIDEVENSFFINTTKPIDLSKAKRIEKIKEDKFNDYQKYVDKYFKDNNITKNKDSYIEEVLITDLNEDGFFETYIVVNTKAVDNEKVNGNYTALLVVDDKDNVKRIMEFSAPKGSEEVFELFTEIETVEVYDLNNDGLKELIVETYSWDIPEVYLFTTNKEGNLSLVMQGNFAW